MARSVVLTARQRSTLQHRAVGLVVTDHFVRAAMVTGDGVKLSEHPLEHGVVSHGDIVDVAALGVAMRACVDGGRFGTKSVVIGLVNRDAVTRQVELAVMSDRDTRSALAFELTDMIPFPTSEASLDFVRVGQIEDDNERPLARILAVAAHHDAVEPLLAAARSGGLRTVAVDLASFGLIRAASVVGAPLGGTRALVYLGDGSLTVVVHDGGVPRFTRRVSIATEGAMDASELEADLDFVERFRNRGRSPGGAMATMVRADPLVAAVAGTLEYYTVQSGAVALSGVDLLGDLDRAREVVVPLESMLGGSVDVRVADEFVDSTPLGDAARGPFAAAIGSVLVGGDDGDGPAALDLMPPPRPLSVRSVAVRTVLVAVASLAAVWSVTVLVGPNDAGVREEADAADVATSSLQARLDALADDRASALELRQGESRVEAIEEIRVPWEILIGSIRAATPPDTTLLSVTARAPQQTPTGSVVGEIELTGQGPSSASASAWLVALAGLPGIEQPWLSSTGTADEEGVAGLATFSVTLQLSEDMDEVLGSVPGAARPPSISEEQP